MALQIFVFFVAVLKRYTFSTSKFGDYYACADKLLIIVISSVEYLGLHW